MQSVIDLTQRNGKTPKAVTEGASTIQTSVQLVTPFQAQIWLDEKAPNRNVARQDKRVPQYAEEMKSGNWRLGDAIKFDVEGRLIDGQHRLMAVIKANIPIEFIIISGYPRDSMIVLDTGKPRSVHQSLTISGVNCSTLHIAVLNAMFMAPGDVTRAKNSKSRQELADLFVKHEDAVRFVSRIYTANTLACKYAPIRAAVARAYYHVDHETLVKFLWILDGRPTEEKRDRAPFLMRNQYLMHRKKLTAAPMLYSKAIYAVKAFADHKTIEALREAKTQPFLVPDFD